ncbi:DeoR/GlpR family DNA-binding transcription regulator [Diplocloster agilis]|uniref:DeoR/GlpR family DNA-binding transcription regulator n=1 Tax=Diplocloster agilis TaxID=2850323 RepID=UPI0008227C25|nr:MULTISPECIES: DeoR/GlpR family DNA-binding transcription regulator [Lachnospiraceae]MBU9744797.1 DeoR/GlpR family DNA-binding transcription regulator [Diplocloster agilis]MCU6735571.1 DeoR/GlpR family DNA-binding transcription regulator [Suonthocola fibrivorans]SCJ77104.1 Glycerol-3-phosphate regulon repressor [uncultured Clostridium sp.]
MSTKTEKRRSEIARLIQEYGSFTSSQLMERFQVSRETIRKDLHHLDQMGLINKTHGGAVMTTTALENLYIPSVENMSDEKKAIAREALALIPDTETIIYVDGGSSAGIFASMLGEHPGLTVVTPSLLAANLMKGMPQHKIFLTGGYIIQVGEMLTNYNMEQVIKDFRFSCAIFGTSGIRFHNGPTVSEHSETNYKSIVAQNSDFCTVLCDHTKFSAGGMASYLSWPQVDYLITDWNAPEDELAKIHAKSIIVAPEAPDQ